MAAGKSNVSAVVFDWAGTTVDFGSCAPVSAFAEIFMKSGVEITIAEAREPMGRGKRDHISTITRMPRVAAAWQAKHGRPVSEADIDKMFLEFLPVQRAAIANHVDLIPGAIETLAWLRERGIAIGSSTGYTRELMSVLVPIAKQSGFSPDNYICIDDVPAGRPAPWMLIKSCELLNASPIWAVVAVDDTVVGIEAARNAGAVAIGVYGSGNALGLSRKEFEALSPADQQKQLKVAEQSLSAAKPDFCIHDVSHLPTIWPDVEKLVASRAR